MWEQINSLGAKGSENGIILQDEEYKKSCRITLEKCPRYYAITCGVYGAMVHTAFCDYNNYKEIYEAMKEELSAFIDRETTEDEEMDFYEYFTNKYQ
ncbi:MAG: hypothetical protein IKW95_05880 [Lachnospiraceae bacterium]|nr:hypothetical protein [Lachnospiraceae bacterium]